MILETACINENIERISQKKGALRPTGSSLFAIEEGVGNTDYIEDSMESKQKHFKEKYREQSYSTVC